MSSKSIREEARERGVSKGKIYTERKAKDRIEKVGGDFWLVYAWRWSSDHLHAKVGKSAFSRLESRLPKGSHPTDDPVLIGYCRCQNEKAAFALERELLNETLERVRPDREWVVIDETFKDVFEVNE